MAGHRLPARMHGDGEPFRKLYDESRKVAMSTVLIGVHCTGKWRRKTAMILQLYSLVVLRNNIFDIIIKFASLDSLH